MNVEEIRHQKSQAWEEMKSLNDAAEKENRDFTADEQEKYDKINKSLDSLEAREKRQKELEEKQVKEIEAKIAEDRREFDEKDEVELEKRYAKAFDQFSRFGMNGIDSNDKKLLSAKRFNGEKRAQSSTDAAGGYFIPDTLASTITNSMLHYGGVEANATIVTTSDGGTINYPTNNDTGNAGARISENTQGAEQDLTIGSVPIEAYTYYSKWVRVSNELLQDSAFDLQSFLASKFAERIGRITNTEFTTGTGTSQPKGIVTGSTLGDTAAGAAAITSDEIIDFYHSLDVAYRANAKFMLNDSTVQYIRKLKDGNNQYLWKPGLADGEEATLLGKPYITNNDMSELATGNKTILFGDMSKFLVRRVTGMSMKRLVERWADFNQTGFALYLRRDADLLDTAAVKHFIQA